MPDGDRSYSKWIIMEEKKMKELVMEVTSTLPDDATFDDIIEAIFIRLKIENGIKDVENGEGLTTEELVKEIYY